MIRRVAGLIAERGTYIVPTMSTWDARERLATQMG